MSTAEQDHRACPLCDETVDPEAQGQAIGTPEGLRFAHRECLLREVLGGIGHLTDHARWCNGEHDPDGGSSRRESALAVDAWVHEHGVAAAAAVPDGTGDGEGFGGAPPVDPDPRRYVPDDRRRLAAEYVSPLPD